VDGYGRRAGWARCVLLRKEQRGCQEKENPHSILVTRGGDPSRTNARMA
jgi:hypothetical protein